MGDQAMPEVSGAGPLDPLLTAIQAGILLRGPDRRVRYVNRAACEVLGRGSDELLGTTPEETLPQAIDGAGRPLDAPERPDEIAASLHRPAGPTLVGLPRPAGRSPVWLRFAASPVDLVDGTGTLTTLQDVTEQEWTARSTVAQAEVLASLVHGDLDLIARRVAACVGAIDPTRWAVTILQRPDGSRALGSSDGVPDAVVRLLLEAGPEDLPARNDVDPRALHPTLGPALAEADVGRMSVHVGLIGVEPVTWLVLGGAGMAGGPDGLARHLPSLGRLLRLAVERDRVATEADAARRDAERTADRLARLIDALPIGLVEVDRDRIVRYINPAMVAMYGHEPQEIVGRHTPMAGETAEWYEQVWADLTAGRSLIGHHGRRRHRDGSPIDVRISYVPSLDGAGEITSVLGIHEDVTARTRLEEQLRQSQKMDAIGQLAGGVAHDFNNLLTVIGGNLELALSMVAEDAPVLPFLREVRDAAERAGGVASQLLAVARPRVARVERFDACELVDELQGLLTRVVGGSTPLLVDACSGACWVEGDRSQLEQVLMNLVLNARDASADGSPIRVEVGAHEEAGQRWVRIRVADAGSGMDAATRERAFEPFFTTKDRHRGTGLGLATSYGIVTQWDGSIVIESEPGRGTTVDVDLPAASGTGTPSSPAETEPRRIRTGSGLVVLLVEDEPALRDLITRALVSAGFTVGAGAVLDEARRTLPDGLQPDVLVTDVVLVGERGTAGAARLREDDPTIPVLYISGYAGGDDGRSALPPDAAFLPKPFRVAELVDHILDLVAERPLTPDRRQA
jgi:two-component system, cell cycle sensor histidine kinase and response regulator CckA